MNNNKIIGIILLLVGAGLLFWGYDLYSSAGAQVSRAIGGGSPTKAYALFAGGAVCVVLGIFKLK
jgi:hypothetical protein